MLGKRVDYSGRSVIVVGPELGLHECGLPKKMALELFKPFIYSKLELYGLASTISCQGMVKRASRSMGHIERSYPRTPSNVGSSSHRLGIQAFEPKLVEGKRYNYTRLFARRSMPILTVIKWLCTLPVTRGSIRSACLMMSTNNILSPANGKPVIVPSQDILGLYYLTMERDGEDGEGMAFGDIQEILLALDNGSVSLQAHVKARVSTFNSSGERSQK